MAVLAYFVVWDWVRERGGMEEVGVASGSVYTSMGIVVIDSWGMEGEFGVYF